MATTKTTVKKTVDLDLATEQTALVVSGEHGTTRIQPHVVAKIAGLAIREVAGVKNLVPFGAGQTLNSLAKSIGGGDFRELGVQVEVGKIEAAVDCRVVVEYGHSIPAVAAAIRDNVEARIGAMTGLQVKETNIEVVDLFFQEDEAAPVESTRVQ